MLSAEVFPLQFVTARVLSRLTYLHCTTVRLGNPNFLLIVRAGGDEGNEGNEGKPIESVQVQVRQMSHDVQVVELQISSLRQGSPQARIARQEKFAYSYKS